MPTRPDAFAGLLLGTAVGDAIGLPREGLSPRRATRMFGPPPLGHGLLLRRGMLSDDTEHACMTAQAWLASRGDPHRFARELAWRLRWWLAAIPAGVGLATLRATLKLWLGVPPYRSGVHSAGNGPAMRAPVLGLLAADDTPRLVSLVEASTRITHTHPLARDGAMAVALAARFAAAHTPTDGIGPLIQDWHAHVHSDDLRTALNHAATAAANAEDPARFAASIGCSSGVSGYMLHTVPASIFCWLRHRADFRASVESVIALGGDTDSTGAVAGSLAGAHLGPGAIPPAWLAGLCDWPRTTNWLQRLAARASQAAPATDRHPSQPLPIPWAALPSRNVLFAAIVLTHGLRRLFPPY